MNRQQPPINTSKQIDNIFKDKTAYTSFLKSFDINLTTGFLAYFDVNEVKLPEEFSEYENIAKNLITLNLSGIFAQIEKLEFNQNFHIEEYFSKFTKEIITKIFSVTSILVNAYMTQHAKLSKHNQLVIPKQLAVPLLKTSKILEIKPVLCLWTNLHAVMIKPDECITEIKSNECINIKSTPEVNLHSVKFAYSQTGTITEDYFLKINNVVSRNMNKLFTIIFEINHIAYITKLEERNLNDIEKSKIKENIFSLIEIMKFTNTSCMKLFKYMEAKVFYDSVRLYLKGYSQFEDGVVFEGSDEVLSYAGASAGQDPYLGLLKEILGYEYPHHLRSYGETLKNSFRKPHLEFIEFISQNCKIKTICGEDPELKILLNKCYELLSTFFNIHNAFIQDFIISVANEYKIATEEINGVGDTPITEVLKLKNYVKKIA